MMSGLIFTLVFSYIVATAYAFPSAGTTQQTACQEHRQRELRSNVPGALVPECEENGSYKARQCHGMSTNGKKFCQCWTEDGSPITSPSRNNEACECVRQRHAAQDNGGRPITGNFVPQCEPNGHFKTRQCHGSTGHCWCVNRQGEKQGEEKFGGEGLAC